ncbi:FHA domain-containing protein [Microbacterium arabinogalactanolyticum]|uniref:FHA domain-containing protein n=1 Tax=Microbacterium arabinogalactanolyticum TaxID=69365 RepID=UPI004043C6E5
MNDVIYRPGEWQVVVEDAGIAALPADASADKVVALSEMLRRGVPALTEVIDVLSGGAITGLGSFAVALIGAGGTRFAVRGAVTVTTGLDEGFSGEDITTWSERYIAGEPRFEIRIGDAPDAVEYPIRSGVVLTSGIRVGEPFTAPEPEAVAEDVPEEDADAALVVDGEQADDVPDADAAALEDAGDEPEAQLEGETTSDGEQTDDVAEPEDASDVASEVASEEAPSEDAQVAEPESAEESASEPSVPDADGTGVSETITPDQMLLARAAADDAATTQAAPAEEPDLGATIRPDVATTIAPPAADEDSPHVAETMAGFVTPIPPAPPLPDAAPQDGATDDIGDHDGATISLAEARRLRAEAATSAPDAPTEAIPVFENAPVAASGARIRLSTGQVVDLDRTVIIGRKPRSTRTSGSTMPHLIAVDSPESDISRNHLEVRPEGDSVVVIDLHTTNGSTLLRPGADPVRLHPGEQTLVLHGDVIDMGDGVTVTVEEQR